MVMPTGSRTPPVITLNSISTSLATTDFLFAFTGLFRPDADLGHRAYYPEERALRRRQPVSKPGCRWCDRDSRYAGFAAGDLGELPLRPGGRPRSAVAQSSVCQRLGKLFPVFA